MFRARYFAANAVTIFQPPDQVVRLGDLLESSLLFVWDELMDPEVVRAQLGRAVPFAPALLEGYRRQSARSLDGRVLNLWELEGEVTAGFVLIGLDDAEAEKLDDYEQVPIHRLRHPCRVRVGDMERVASVHLSTGSYLGE